MHSLRAPTSYSLANALGELMDDEESCSPGLEGVEEAGELLAGPDAIVVIAGRECDALVEALAAAGYASTRSSVAAITDALRSSSRGVVVVDYRLPGARALLRDLHAVGRASSVALVREPAEISRALQDGADDVLCAPWHPDQLIARVEVARQRARGRGEASSSGLESWATHTDDAIVILDHVGRVVGWNLAAVAVLGHEQRAILGRSFVELIDADADEREHMVQELLSRAHGGSTRLSLRHADGDAQEFAITVTVWRDGGSARIGLRVEEGGAQEVEEELMRLASFPELDPNPVLELSRSGELSYANPAMEALPEETGRALTEGVRSVIAKFGQDEGVDLVREVRCGETWYEQHIHYAPAWDSVRVYAQDVTERKGAEQRLIEAKDTLEVRVRERTIDLQREVEVRKIAEGRALEASQAKSSFLATMSHELRTPLNAIIGFSELLHEESEDPTARSDLEKILQAANHLLGLINDILDLSKIEAGRSEVRLETLDIGELVSSVAVTVRPIAAARGNAIVTNFTGELGGCISDRTKLRQVVMNLVGNAAKFTKDGTITIDVGAEGRDAERWITISVSDTGIGIPMAKLETIFDPFTQADSSTTRKYGGTGLGLTISKKICNMLGGTISVESTLGQGSTFTIHLPAVITRS